MTISQPPTPTPRTELLPPVAQAALNRLDRALRPEATR